MNSQFLKQITKTQHFTTNDILISNFDHLINLFENQNIIEPFYGNGDLIKLLTNKYNIKFKNILKYDIDPTMNVSIKDILINPVIKSDSFIITNPPYGSKVKMSNELKDKYNHLFNNSITDLYHIFINQLINNVCLGGLLIVLLNFIIGKQTETLRNQFLNKYIIQQLNIYECKTFENTTQSVISFIFTKRKEEKFLNFDLTEKFLNFDLIESNIKSILLYNSNYQPISFNPNILNQTIESTFKTSSNVFKRFYDIDFNTYEITHIKINLLDTTKNKIKAIYDNEPKENKISDRTFINICIKKNIVIDENKLIELFNKTLNEFRDKTHSLTLTSYREFNRKRLTIKESLIILNWCFDKLN